VPALRAIVLTHADFEGPARIADRLAAHGHAIDVRSLHRGDRVPARLERGELLVVMGGPMGVADRTKPETGFLRAEIDLLQTCVARDVAVLGICLGAQLLAHAAGARVYPMVSESGARLYEVGWAPIRLDHEAGAHVLADLPGELHVLHWHGDTFDLPPGATLLASSSVCRQQAFRVGRRIFGLQFHCEVDREHVDAFLRADGEFVRRANGASAVDDLRAQTERHVDESRRIGDRLLDNIIAAMLAD
jgi:GMP synthase-like glutamine amidotransferase